MADLSSILVDIARAGMSDLRDTQQAAQVIDRQTGAVIGTYGWQYADVLAARLDSASRTPGRFGVKLLQQGKSA